MAAGVMDIAWAAGFVEGEGCLHATSSAPMLDATQCQREPLDKLQRIFGGKVRSTRPKTSNHQEVFIWGLRGSRAIAVMMTLYSFFSPRRKEQARNAIANWKTLGTYSAFRNACPQGHSYTPENTHLVNRSDRKNPSRQCITCHTAQREKYVAAHPERVREQQHRADAKRAGNRR